MNTPTDNAWLDEILAEAIDKSVVGEDRVALFKAAKQAILSHIDTVCREARIAGAKDYNRVLTDNLPSKPEHTAIGLEGIVSIYRQLEVGEAVRKANQQCIQLNPNKDTDPVKRVRELRDEWE